MPAAPLSPGQHRVPRHAGTSTGGGSGRSPRSAAELGRDVVAAKRDAVTLTEVTASRVTARRAV
jgi:hypothetical protein